MQFLRAMTQDEVTLTWLRSEWWKLEPHLPTGSRVLIDQPDLNDPEQNRMRAEILHAHREPLLDPIPTDAQCQHVRIEEADLPDLFILTSWDWYLDTGGTFALTNTLAHLQEGRGGLIDGHRENVDHVNTVKEKLPYIQDRDSASNEYLVLVATDESGPYTIIDGTHRAVALLEEHQRTPNMPWNAIFIESPLMGTNRWHIGFDQAPAILGGLRLLAERGELW
jgi:hypothetical protein